MSTAKKYVKVPNQKGIWKNTLTKKYLATKKIKGKQFTQTFATIRHALHWKHTFDGVKRNEIIQHRTSTLGDVWTKMRELHFPSLELSTRRIWERRWMHLSSLENYHMEDISSEVINNWIETKKKWFSSDEYAALGRGYAGRCNLYNELNLFQTIFNWYKAEDYFEEESKSLTLPLRPRHKKMAFIKDPPKKPEDKKIPVEAAFEFFSALPELYRDLAMFQFFTAGRISEAAGVQISNIYMDQEFLVIKDVCSWCNSSKMFEYLKPYPKNREPRRVHIHSALREIIERRLKARTKGCNFLFHVDGKPLNYCTIQSNYRHAQRRTKIPYTGTHCLRHGMATLARKVGGMGLDSVIAMTGHKDLKLADHYSKIDGEVQKETSLKILNHIQEIQAKQIENESSLSNVVALRRVK